MDQTTFLFVKCILEYGFIVSCLIGNIAMFLYKIYDYKKCRKEHPDCPIVSCFSCRTPKRHMLTEEEREELLRIVKEQD